MKKILTAFCFFAIAHAAEINFSDMTPQDPAFECAANLAERDIFVGRIDESGKRVAEPGNVISKLNSGFFLAKLLGEKNPDKKKLLEMEIFVEIPESKVLLNHATWIKMLSNAFELPVEETEDPSSWFVAPFVIAQSVGAVADEKPFDIASRRFMLSTACKYENLFGKKNANEIMDTLEINLMKIRDNLTDAQISNTALEKLIWQNILLAEEVPENSRINSIKSFNTALLQIFAARRDPNPAQKKERQKRVDFFLKKAVDFLPETQPFAENLQKIFDGL